MELNENLINKLAIECASLGIVDKQEQKVYYKMRINQLRQQEGNGATTGTEEELMQEAKIRRSNQADRGMWALSNQHRIRGLNESETDRLYQIDKQNQALQEEKREINKKTVSAFKGVFK